MGIKRWKMPGIDMETVAGLGRETGLSPVVCGILAARGIASPAEAQAFAGGSLALASPFDLADMEAAVQRINQALEEGERIAVYGDYDCDGITATTLLTSYLQSVGADVLYYIPSREKEGYGLNNGAVDVLHQQKVNLVVTVDNGISAHGEIAYAASLGMDVVVTDHHTPKDTLPPAVAVVNPHRADCPSHFKGLAGVGVAFKLVCALEQAEAAELLEYYSDLVALGTVADVVPLVDENRVIVRHGLARLCESERPGIQALLQVSGLAGKTLTGEMIAFGIIPRINAAGRMGCVDDAIELLLTDDEGYAEDTAQMINGCNEERKKIEEAMVNEIEGMLRENPQILTKRVLVVAGNGWHHGVVGIAAAKVMEKYGKPTILFSIDSGMARGSGRSLEGFSLIKAIDACSQHLTQYGGHTLAAGLTLPATELDAFQESLEQYAAQACPVMPVPELRVDWLVEPGTMTIDNMKGLECLEPFGACNEMPLFMLQGLRIEAVIPTSDAKHLRIRMLLGGQSFTAVYFRMSERSFPYKAGDVVDAVASVSVGVWNGNPQLSVKIKDLRRAGLDQERAILSADLYMRHSRGEYGDSQVEDLLPGREDMAAVYRTLRKAGGYTYGRDGLYCQLAEGIDYCRMCVALDVLEEMGLIGTDPASGAIKVVPDAPKADLERSVILTALRGRTAMPVS